MNQQNWAIFALLIGGYFVIVVTVRSSIFARVHMGFWAWVQLLGGAAAVAWGLTHSGLI